MRPLSLPIAPLFALLVAAACTNKDKDVDETDTVVDTDVEVETDETDPVVTDDTDSDVHTDDGHTDPDSDPHTDVHTDDTGAPLATLADLVEGDLVITEIATAPAACAAPNGQYVEIYYRGTEQLDLNGLVLSSASGTVSLSSTLIVQPGEYVLLVRSTLSANCYGLVGDWSYGTITFDASGDVARISSTTTVFDEVDFTGAAWDGLREAGKSMQLKGVPNALANDQADSWCPSSVFSPLGATGDTGTPRSQSVCDSGGTEEPPGDLLLTEIMDFADNGAIRYVEVYNPGNTPMPLDGWEILVFTDGAALPAVVPLDTNATLQPDRVWTIASSLSTFPMYVQAGIPLTCGPDQFDSRIDGNGDDAIVLAYRGTPVDVYGQPGVDGTGTPWEYTDSVAVRDDSVRTPVITWNASEWTITSDFQQSSICRFDEPYVPPTGETDTDRDSFQDTYIPIETDTFYTGPGDSGDPIVFEPLSVLSPGDIVINEVMTNPGPGCGDESEFIEIVMNTARFIDLNGLTLQIGSTSFLYTGNLRAFPFGHVVLYRHPVGDAAGNCYFGDASSQAIAYSGAALDLPSTGAVVRVRNAGTVFDEVNTAVLPYYHRGVSWQLDPTVYDEDTNTPSPSAANNDADAWCVAGDAIPGTSDLGSPGITNYCGTPIDTGDTDRPTGDDTETDHTDVIPPTLVDALVPGDLIITEIMIDPAVPCDDTNGEYIEVFNTTLDRVDLDGLVVDIDGNTSTLTGPFIIGPGEFAILSREPATTFCHNIGLAERISYDATLELLNTGGAVAVGNGSITLDDVDFSTWTPISQTGAAWSLDSSSVSPTANNSQSSWCASGTTISSQNLGTPNGVFVCPAP